MKTQINVMADLFKIDKELYDEYNRRNSTISTRTASLKFKFLLLRNLTVFYKNARTFVKTCLIATKLRTGV